MIDLTGKKFNHLTAIYSVSGSNGRLWYCMCDCGKIKKNPVSAYQLKSGKIKDCGCMKKTRGNFRHGQYDTKLYKIWSSMKRRCNAPNDKYFSNYGGRGIGICDEWTNDFMEFYKWAHANGYKEGLTIERIDVNGDYEPSNCTWIPKSKQTSNRRINKYITYKGETKILKQWAGDLGLPYSLVQSRLKKLGWSVEKAFETPLIPLKQSHIKPITFNKKTQSIAAWARELNINYSYLYKQICRGKKINEIIQPEIEALTGIETAVAEPGLEVELELYPY